MNTSISNKLHIIQSFKWWIIGVGIICVYIFFYNSEGDKKLESPVSLRDHIQGSRLKQSISGSMRKNIRPLSYPEINETFVDELAMHISKSGGSYIEFFAPKGSSKFISDISLRSKTLILIPEHRPATPGKRKPKSLERTEWRTKGSFQ